MFVRFVIGAGSESHRDLTGLITHARLLRDRGELATHQLEQVETAFGWFNQHVPCPPFSSSGGSCEAVSWFKDGAVEPLKRMRDLAVTLDARGMQVRMLRSPRPGEVLYADSTQVVVEEWEQLARSW